MMVKEMINMSNRPNRKSDTFVVVSHKEDEKPKRSTKIVENPLTVKQKKNALRMAFPKDNYPNLRIWSTMSKTNRAKYKNKFSGRTNLPNLPNNIVDGQSALSIIYRLRANNYDDITMVVGSNRGPDEKKGFGWIKNKFPNVHIVVIGKPRTNNPNNITGMSGSLARKYAVSGQRSKFRSCIPTGVNNKSCNAMAATIRSKKRS